MFGAKAHDGKGLFDKVTNAFNPFQDNAGKDDPMGIYKNNGELRVGKAERLQLTADHNRLQQDPNSFGFSDEKKDEMAAQAADTAGKQNQALATELAQAALAGDRVAATGLTDAAHNMAADNAAAAVKARTGINDLHTRMIESAKQDITNRIHAERMSKKQEAQFWAKTGIDGTANLVAAVGEAIPG